MSKFTDRLDRLHKSRVRALEADPEEGEQKRVFVAEPEPPTSPSSPPERSSPTPQSAKRPPPVDDTPARAAVRDQLEIGARLGSRPSGARKRRNSDKQKLTMTRDSAPRSGHEAPARRAPQHVSGAPSDNAVGERLGDLRTQAEALIGAGGLASALPILHEMGALAPTHPFPLTHLAEYWRAQGDDRLADHYAQRLAAIAPY